MQGELFDPSTSARTSDPDTSHQAADRVAKYAPSQAEQVYDVLRRMPSGGTASEIAAAIAWLDKIQVTRRLNDLRGNDLAWPSDRRRPNPGGRNEMVWVTS